MRLSNELILNAGDASGDLTSTQGLVAHVFGYSIQIVITGTPEGDIKLQGSSDPVPDASFKVSTFPVANWTDIECSTKTITGAGTLTYDVADVFYNWVRVIYTATSGIGTLTMRLNTKGF